MSCPAIASGDRFVVAVLEQIDCQAQAIGAYGYGALADPNSPVASLLLALLTLFIALFGLRLMFGEAVSGRDLLGDMLKVGIVLTLATSWPAWRTLAYQVVLEGPSEISGTLGLAAGLPGGQGDLNARLDAADKGLVALTAFGTGRLTGGVVGGTDLGDTARGIALADQTGFSWGRVLFLVGTIGPLALVRLASGILLALAPLMAGLLLFAGTRDLFMGWLRGLGACALGAAGLGIVYGVELAMLEGWLRDVLVQREANVLTPAAPTELLVLALAFTGIAWGLLALIARMMFFSMAGPIRLNFGWREAAAGGQQLLVRPALAAAVGDPQRALQVAEAVSQSLRREGRDRDFERQLGGRLQAKDREPGAASGRAEPRQEALGQSYRRNHRRHSATAARRDGGS